MKLDQPEVMTLVAVLLKMEVIDNQKISIKTLAERCMMEEKTISEILSGRPLTKRIAEKLEQGTAIPSTAWIILNQTDIEDFDRQIKTEDNNVGGQAVIIDMENYRR